MQTLAPSGKMESISFPEGWLVYLFCAYIFVCGLNASQFFLQSSYQEPSRKINVPPVCHDRILCKLCKPNSPVFMNPTLCLWEEKCMCKEKRGLSLWTVNMSGVVVGKRCINQALLYQKCQTYCIIFTFVSFLGNTLRMFKGCGKEETLSLKH